MKCPICNEEMQFINGAWLCSKNEKMGYPSCHRVIVLCECGRRMQPMATYFPQKGTWKFWRCPHCFKRF